MPHYLMRFDDLCPTMNHAKWARCEALMRRFSIRPIIAVVPENHDPKLVVDAEDPAFWHRMRGLENEGFTIALHGWRHDCRATGKSLVPLYRRSEFAGLPEDQQLRMLEKGMHILRGHGLAPRVWVAPRHGFDRATLKSLRRVGIPIVSDGYFRLPYVEDGLLWIPQQLAGPPQGKPSGVRTICLHPNTMSEAMFRSVEAFLDQHASEFLSVDEICERWGNRRKGIADTLQSYLWVRINLGKYLARKGLRRILRATG